MPKNTDVDAWLARETKDIRRALENASRYFDRKDALTVNTLEAVYGQETSFRALKRNPGIKGAAGCFQLQKGTAERYHLIVSKENDQRFDIDYASIAAARYLKDLDRSFSMKTILGKQITFPVKDTGERKKFVLAAYNGGEGAIATAQFLAEQAGKDPANWNDVQGYLEQAGAYNPGQIRKYVENVPKNEAEFAKKSLADKKAKDKKIGKPNGHGSKCHWVTIDGHPVCICD
ncbi:MAG: transglycosylase SLT domain-containing protein [Candidatus Omnitrophica bacterium]|nr:transglycosylase SLT domain-containing protein [Candidatus Omnitrophota bacterium]